MDPGLDQFPQHVPGAPGGRDRPVLRYRHHLRPAHAAGDIPYRPAGSRTTSGSASLNDGFTRRPRDSDAVVTVDVRVS